MSDDYSPPEGMNEGETVPAGRLSSKKQSSLVLNIIMIVIGLVFFSKGVLEFLAWLKVFPLPDWLKTIAISLDSRDMGNALSFLGTQGIISATLGFWAVIAGFLMFGEQESGWGMALVILSIMVVMSVSAVLTWILNPKTLDLAYWPNWITMVAIAIGLFGFIYLLATKKRYS
ncbi:MAG: hypothetical protein JW881_12125 [Spirochaetales bacterium]|nr:hypothetical protein [Spirochaetales bacterium]